MAVARFTRTLGILAVLYTPLANAADDEEQDAPSVAAHPSGGEIYLSTSEIVVSGTFAHPPDSFVVEISDARDTVLNSGSGNCYNEKSHGAWALRLAPPKPRWRAGDFRFSALAVFGAKAAVPIKIIDDERHRAAGRLEVVSELTDDEIEALPVVSFPEMSVDTTDADRLKVTRRNPKPAEQKKSAETPRVQPGKAFALGGTARVERPPRHNLAPVVLQIIEERKMDDGEKLEVIVNEDFTAPEKTESGFQFAKPLMAPRVEGRYIVRALYHRTRLAETPIEAKTDVPEATK